MSEQGDFEDRHLPTARSIRTRWPGIVWAIPLAALIVVGYLGIRALTRKGIDVVVTFNYAEGVTPNDTKVLVAGVEAGQVRKVRVAADGKHVDVTLRLDPREKKALNTNTKFWLIGEHPTITDIQSIRAAVVGVIIAMAPGTGGEPTTQFEGLDQPPVIPPGTQGTSYTLVSEKMGSIQPGASVAYRGFAIGKVVTTGMARIDDFRMTIFVNKPWDALVKHGAQFWSGSPLKLSLSGASITAGLTSPASVLQGQVSFDLPKEYRAGPPAKAGTVFQLYDDQSAAEQGPTGPEMAYRLVLNGVAGDLETNGTVTMLGYAVGRVRSARLVFAPGGKPYTEAVITIYPKKLDVSGDDRTSLADWRAGTDRAVAALLAQGFRARLVQSPPLIGAHAVDLARTSGVGPASLIAGGRYPQIPVADGGAGSDDLMAHANSIMAKVDAMPLGAIGDNVRRLTGNLAGLTGSPQMRDSLTHLNGTLRQLDAMMAQVSPKVGPLMTKLDQTATELQGTAQAARAMLSGEGAAQGSSVPDAIRQLDQTARSIRALTDYLGRHPEALIRGKAKEKK